MSEKPKKQNTIEVAKSGRASCRGCGDKIDEGALRFGLVDLGFSASGSHRWFHLACAWKKQRDVMQALLDEKGEDLDLESIEREIESVEDTAKKPTPARSPSPAEPPAGPPRPPVVATLAADERPPWLVKAKAPTWKVPHWTKLAPPVLTHEGKALDLPSAQRLWHAIKRSDKNVEKFVAFLDPRSLRRHLWVLFTSWAERDGHMGQRWVFDGLRAVLDDELAMQLGPIIERWIQKNKKNAAKAGLEVLVEHGTATSLMVVQRLAQRFHYKGVYNLPRTTLSREASRRKMSLDELEDRLVPSCGLDEQGTRVFEYGKTSYRLLIDGELSTQVRAESGKRLRSLPREGLSGDDPVKVREAQAQYRQLQNEVGSMLEVQRARLERALSSGRDWSVSDWTELLREHPLMRHLTRRLVWGQYDTDGQLARSFRVDEENLLTDEHDDAIELAQAQRIRVVHPADLSESSRGAWGELFSDYELIPPFAQLARPVMSVHADDAGGKTLHRFPARAVELGPLHGTLNRLGWIKGDPDDHVKVRFFAKRFDRAGIWAVLALDPGFDVAGLGDEPQTPTEIYFVTDAPHGIGGDEKKRVPLADVPAPALSEVLYDAATLAG